MKLSFLLFVFPFIALSGDSNYCEEQMCDGSFSVSEGSICEGWKFAIEPDMQITDSDLSEEYALSSIDWLSENFTKEGHVYDLGKENRLKRIKGYMLKKAFLESMPAHKDHSRKAYCSWLKQEGFWND